MNFKLKDIAIAQAMIANGIGAALEKRGVILREELAPYIEAESAKILDNPGARYLGEITAKALRSPMSNGIDF